MTHDVHDFDNDNEKDDASVDQGLRLRYLSHSH